jgi:hypothetical protein
MFTLAAVAEVERRLRLAATALVGGPLHLVAGCGRRVDLLDQLDLRLLEHAVELLDVGLVEVQLGRRGRDLGKREYAYLLTLGQQRLDLVEFL